MGIAELWAALFGTLDFGIIGPVLFVVWLVKHLLNVAFPKSYTNWAMPLVAWAIAITISMADGGFSMTTSSILASIRVGTQATAASIALFSVYSNLMKGYNWWKDSNDPDAAADAEKSVAETQKLISNIPTLGV